MAVEKLSIRLTADSIQSFDDVKPWARSLEAKVESRFDQNEGALDELKKKDEENKASIKRNSRWLIFSIGLFASALAIIVFLFGIDQMFWG